MVIFSKGGIYVGEKYLASNLQKHFRGTKYWSNGTFKYYDQGYKVDIDPVAAHSRGVLGIGHLPETDDIIVKGRQDYQVRPGKIVRYYGEWPVAGTHPYGKGIMIDDEEFVLELGWWVNGRLAHKDEF